MDGEWDVLAAKAEYATTPLELMALAELNDAAFSALRAENDEVLRGNLDVLARLVPPSCVVVQDVHDYLEPKVAKARQKLTACEATFTSYDNAGAQVPLIAKIGWLRITHLAEE